MEIQISALTGALVKQAITHKGDELIKL